jgi:DNA end-binding protein Ku
VGALIAEVKVKKATSPKGTELKYATPDGREVKQVYVCEETGEVFPRTELVKGVFMPDGFREVPADQMAVIDEESKLDSLDVEGFVPLAQVPWDRVEGSYFLAPGGKAGPVTARALVILRDAMTKAKLAGYGRLTFRTKQHVFLIYPSDGGLLLSTMVFADQSHVREAGEVLEGVVSPSKKALDLAVALVESMATDAAGLDALTDDRTAKREELVAQVLAGKKVKKTAKPKAEVKATEDLEALLVASLAQATEKKKEGVPA